MHTAELRDVAARQAIRDASEVGQVYRNSLAAGHGVAGSAYNAIGTGAATLVGVRGASDLFSRHDAVDAHVQSMFERGVDGLFGTVQLASLGLSGAGALRLPAAAGLGRFADDAAAPVVSQGVRSANSSFAYGKKIQGQIPKRGWSDALIDETISSPRHVSPALNKGTQAPATAYFRQDGSYIVRENASGRIIQVSDRFKPNWAPDSTIQNPYSP
jgi:hypothetical protein